MNQFQARKIAAMTRHGALFVALAFLTITGIAQAGPKITMPLVTGLYDGYKIYYVNTEASDAGVAAADGTTFVPKLVNAIQVGATADIFHVTNFSQPNVVDSVPNPVNAHNTNTDYSPLWRLTLVTWKTGYPAKQLASEAEILAARDAGMVELSLTDIVINCAVVVTPWGHLPSAIAINIEDDNEAETSTITLPLIIGFVNDKKIFYINTEASDQGVATTDGTTYAPKLAATHASGAEADIFPFIGKTNPAQHNIVDSTPSVVGPTNTDPQYSPLWDVVPLQFTNPSRTAYPLVRSTAAIQKLQASGDLQVGPEAGIIVNCPIVRTIKK
ncbi:MAG: hypothetical protein HY080_03595 [Gammaproteobacteria bacterium]|nr:hypothetical protein [Gammaproteobacteria bacterium]